MADSNGRFVRWQATQVTQLGFILNLVLGFAVAALGLWASLLRDTGFHPDCWAKCFFDLSAISLVIAITTGLLCSLNRLWDFRITAGIARGNWNGDELKDKRRESDLLGKLTWRLLYLEISMFSLGIFLLMATLALVYRFKLF